MEETLQKLMIRRERAGRLLGNALTEFDQEVTEKSITRIISMTDMISEMDKNIRQTVC